MRTVRPAPPSPCARCACSAQPTSSIAVPNRFRHGYGLSPGLVEELARRSAGAAAHGRQRRRVPRGRRRRARTRHVRDRHRPPSPGSDAAGGRCDRESESRRRRIPEQGDRRRRRRVLPDARVARASARERAHSVPRGPSPIFRRCSISLRSAPSPISCRSTRTTACWSRRACAACARDARARA